MISRQMRYRGSLMGLAAGDALGATLEFKRPGTFEPMTDMVGGGKFDLEPGQWTDDTSMALCLAESLVECGGFDPRDQMNRYIRWWKDGYLSSNGWCFDIGNTVKAALKRYRRTDEPFAGSADPDTAGNGSLMRLAPAPLFYAADPEEAVRMSGESSRTTHAARTCIDACRYYGGLIVGAVNGASKGELLSPRYTPVAGLWDREPLGEKIANIADGSFRRNEPPVDPENPEPDDIVGTGYVVESLEAALWAFHKASDFAEGCLLAANLGDDADTTPAIYGQLAGAHYGFDGIPERWRELVSGVCGDIGRPLLIVNLADGLMRDAN